MAWALPGGVGGQGGCVGGRAGGEEAEHAWRNDLVFVYRSWNSFLLQ
jgi:hypothetical protein